MEVLGGGRRSQCDKDLWNHGVGSSLEKLRGVGRSWEELGGVGKS